MHSPVAPMKLVSLCLAGALATAPAIAQTPSLAMLDGLERGQWVLRDRDNPATTRSYCVTDFRHLLQLQHQGRQCTRTVLENSASAVTVHYSCPGAGHGRTTIRRETNRLLQIDTQGIASGAPFSLAFEARRAGTCG